MEEASMNSRAFTLLEMMVAIAVLLILGTLTCYAIVSARERGDATHCVANLRQLAGANLLYAADHDGVYAPAQEPMNLVRWHGRRNKIGASFDPRRGPLAPYLGKEARVKLCPTLRHFLNGDASFEDGTGGYGYNAAYIGGIPDYPFRPERMVNIPRPAETVMFTDTAFPRRDGIQEYAYAEPRFSEGPLGRFRNSLYASVHFRHGGLANVAWCDGHVTAEPASYIDGDNNYQGDAKKWLIGWFGPSDKNGPWRP
jgi:prepilin-type processing-associated H-X9-DG protein/prepilin-type N-terminal cleavage/methylation domain-containing protein